MVRNPQQRSLFPSDDPPPQSSGGGSPPVPSERVSQPEQELVGAVAPSESHAWGDAAPLPADSAVESLEGKTVYVIDAHSLIHQVFHALPEMTSPRGEPVGAVFGFARDLFYLLEEKKPDYLFCAFDMPGPTFRHELYAEYKGDRPEMHADLKPQIESIRRMLDTMEIASLGVPGFEADDLLATLAARTVELGGQCYLVTADKDCRQLLSDRVLVYNIRKDELFDVAALRQQWGIRPDQVVDFQSLVGDASDNVPGVPLIGPKFAQQLLEQYETLDEVLAHAAEVSGAKRKENLLSYGDQARLSRQLVRLDGNVPVTIDWQAGRVKQVPREPLRVLFTDFGFRSLAAKMADAGAAVAAPASAPVASALAGAEYRLVATPAEFADFLGKLREKKRFAFDTETTSVSPRAADLVGMSFAWEELQGWYLPVRAPAGEVCLDPAATLDALRPILEDPSVEKVGQNLKYDAIVLRRAGVRLAGIAFDTMVASYLLDAGTRSHNLDELARRWLQHETIKIESLIGSGKNQRRMDEAPTRLVADYAGEDALVAWRLVPLLGKRLGEAGLEPLFRDVELPLIDVLVELEYNGIRVDVGRLAELSQRYGERMQVIEAEIYALAGRPFNLASPKQLQEVLFDELHLPVVKRTKTGPSTDAEVLEQLAELHALPAKIIEYRQYAKLKSTYVDALPEMVLAETGRVHASFNQVVAATGRLSSSDPNLQNIPVRTEEGREIRSAFVPGGDDWLLLAADYSQIELRVLAHYSQDPRLLAAFANDEDIHAAVAAALGGVPLTAVTDDMRRRAKTVNFGVIYGQSPFGLAKQLGIEQGEAAAFIESYFSGYPGIENFMQATLSECRRNGYVGTVLGRRRAIEGVRPEPGRQKNLAERTAINSVIQGSAADLMKLAMIHVHRRLARERLRARMLLQIHDELIFEVPSDELDGLAVLVSEEMVGAYALRVPLKVDLKSGPNWAEAKPWRLPRKA